MPNQNPSGPNQPLNQHPVPQEEIYGLAKDAKIYPDLDAASGDVLIVPPPVAGGRRKVSGCISAGVTGTGTVSATVALVYKNKNGNEAILSTVTPAGLTGPEDFEVSMFLVPEDEGLFLRVTTDAPGEKVFAFAQWDDVRNIERADTPLTDSFQNVNPPTPLGNTAFSPRIFIPDEEEFEALVHIYNFDTDPHDFEIEATDGTTTLGPITLASGVPAGEGVRTPLPCTYLPPGFFFRARVSAGAIETKAPVFSLPLSLINQGPARQEQGGAY